MELKTCRVCGQLFEPKSSTQRYCNKSIYRECKVCHTKFETICNGNLPDFCSRSCASKGARFKEYTCVICGSKFHPNSSRQKYCKRPTITHCKTCGKEIVYPCGSPVPSSCSDECLHKFQHIKSVEYYRKTTRICKWCGKEFHPVNNTQIYCENKHYRECEVCGKTFEVDVTKGLQDMPRTCSKECSIILRFQNGNPFKDPIAREKAKKTCLERYGVEHPAQSQKIRDRMWNTYKETTGFSHPSHNPEVRSKQVKNSKLKSAFEQRVANLLNQYNIEYEHPYMLNNNGYSHEFDFYIEKYKIFVDCDRVYYHGYLSDPDGGHVSDYYDEDRIAILPKDHILHVIVEGQEEKDIKYLVDIMKSEDPEFSQYDSDLFKWCRSIEFPYPEYTEERLHKDYMRLCAYTRDSYSPYSRLGDSIIQQFHHSIYSSRVGNYVSPIEAWYDDKLLKKVILNRLIYKNEVDPFKILKGFNISKICPRVSVFNPVLAKYLVNTYLSEFDEVFDPFSGFSGRLLGVVSTGRRYIGQDLNSDAVRESNQIIQFLDLSNVSVVEKDILESQGEYSCLLTCPPYDTKEHYNNESVFKSCDEWITEILNRFKCNKYVFVVDNTEKYSQFVVEELSSTSHFVKLKERVIVIDS